MSGDLKAGLLAVCQSIRNRPEYFADKLRASMKGAGTDDRTLQRIMISRCEIDMEDIRQAYVKKHNKTLEGDIDGDTSGHYKQILRKLAGVSAK